MSTQQQDFETARDSYDSVDIFVDALEADRHGGAGNHNNDNNGDENNNNNNNNNLEQEHVPVTNEVENESEKDTMNHNEVNTENNSDLITDNNDKIEEQRGTGNEEPAIPQTKEASRQVDAEFWKDRSFYINRAKDAHDNVNDINQLVNLIEAHGGTIIDVLPEPHDQSNMTGQTLIVSPYNDTNLVTVTPTYVKACVHSQQLLPYQNYMIPYDRHRNVITQSNTDNEQVNDQRDNSESVDSFFPAVIDYDPPQIDGHNGKSNNMTVTDPDLEAAMAASSDSNKNIKEQQALLQQHNADRSNGQQDSTPSLGIFKSNPTSENSNHVTPETGSRETSSSLENTEGKQIPNDGTDNDQEATSKNTAIPGSFGLASKRIFTLDEDDFILDVVRKNPTRRSTHSLFDEISKYMPNHTGNSIRHRFRGTLSKRLEFVYEVDRYGKLVRDERGNFIKTKVLPPSLKRKFTAEEDYSLSLGIKKQFYRDKFQVDPDTGLSLISHSDSAIDVAKRSMIMDHNHIPGNEPHFKDYRVNERRGPITREFFKNFSDTHPTHSENAWRDRFRKFISVHGIDKYIAYYEDCEDKGIEPQALKNLTLRKRRVGHVTPGNFNQDHKRIIPSDPSEHMKYVKKTKFNDSPGHNINDNIENEINNHIDNKADVGEKTNSVSPPTENNHNEPEVNTNDSIDNNNEKHLSETPSQDNKSQENISHNDKINNSLNSSPDKSDMDNDNDNDQSKDAKQPNDFSHDMLDEETRKFIANLKENLDTATDGLPFEYNPDEPDTLPPGADMQDEYKYDDIDPHSITWPPRIATSELFAPKFFEFNNTTDFFAKLKEIAFREYATSQAELLVQDLAKECGIRRNFSTAVLTSLSGDIVYIPRYFLNMFKNNINPPSDVPGIWTARDDALLRYGTPEAIEELITKHGKPRVDMRKRFIDAALV